MVKALILNWNNSKETISLIKQLKTIENNLEFIVIDNNSDSNEKDILINNFLKFESYQILKESDLNNKIENYKNFLLLLDKNYGYARGNNFGLKLAEKLSADYVIIMNNDIKIEKPFIKRFLDDFKRDNKIAIMSGKVMGPYAEQGPNRLPNFFDWFLYPLFLPFLYKLKKKKERKNQKYQWFTGCFLFVDLKKFKEIGYFDENTFLFLEEPIIFKKFYNKGYISKKIDDIEIKHLHGITTSKISKKIKFSYLKESINYYFKEYEKMNNFSIKLIIFANYVRFFFWEPIIKNFVKKGMIK